VNLCFILENNMAEEFDSVRFAECFKNYLLHNEVITNEAIHMQNTIKQMLACGL